MPNSIPCLDVPQFIFHSFPEGHLGCFQYLAIMNKTALSNYRQDFYGYALSTLLGKILTSNDCWVV